MDKRTIREYKSLLPQHIKHRLEGNLMIVETPDKFDEWINDGTTNLLVKLRNRLTKLRGGS